MQCQYLSSRSPVARAWHLLRCVECRAARSVDATISRGLERLASEPAPTDGMAQSLALFGAMPAARPLRKRRWWSAIMYRLPATGVVTALATIGTAGWLAYIDIDPKVQIPSPMMPSVNSYDDLLRAASSIPAQDKPKKWGDSGTKSGPERIAAALADGPNLSRIQPTTSATKPAASAEVKPPPYTIAESKALLEEYAETRSLIRLSLTHPYHATTNRSMPYLAEYRLFARILALEAKVKAAEGDSAGAVNSGLDAIELGASIQHGGSIISKLVGIACEAIGRAQVWQHIDHLTAAEARLAARRVEHIMTLHVPYSETLEIEKWGNLANLKELFESKDWRLKLTDYSGNVSNPASGLAGYLRLLPHTKRDIIDRYTRLADYSISEARRSYFDVASQSMEANGLSAGDNRLQREAEADPVTQLYFPIFSQARFQDEAQCKTQNALLAVKLAVRAFECDRHRYPRSLSELVPGYLQSVPQDPCADHQLIGYRLASIDGGPVGPVIYSIGPDLRDDGGVPAIDPSVARHTKNRTDLLPAERAALRVVSPGSKGDIVAGINVK